MLRRNDIAIDTNIELNREEMKAIKNLSSYICGYKYDKDTIEKDIEIVHGCYKLNPGHKLMMDFDKLFMEFLNKKSKECEFFSKTLLHPKENKLYQDVLEYERLPFRYSRNPEVDMKLLGTILDAKSFDYGQIIHLLSPREYSTKLSDALYNFINAQGIFCEKFGEGPKIGWVSKFPNNDIEICDNFEEEKDLYNEEKNLSNPSAIGNYAELVFYKYLSKKRKDNERLLWVSRFVGDGFGYDIMSYNTSNKEVKLYEVKGSVSQGNCIKIELTEKESEMLKYAKENNIEYHMVKLFLNNEERLYDVFCKDRCHYLNKINDNKPRRVFVTSNENDKKLTYQII